MAKNIIKLKVDSTYLEQPVAEATGSTPKLVQSVDTDILVLVKDRRSVADISGFTSATMTLATAADPETAVITKTVSSFNTNATEDQFDSGSAQHFTVSLTAADMAITEGTYYMRLTATDGSTTAQLSAGAVLVLDKDTGLDVVPADPVLYIPKSLLTTRGDLIVRGATGPQRLALGLNGQVLQSNGTDAVWGNAGTGDVTGPASSTDNALARFDSTTGKVIQNGSTIEDDLGNLTVNGNISVTGTVDGRDVAADGTKLDGIEANADVTDETNVKSALDGATITSATVAGTDKVLIQDVDDANNLKTVTAQSIADLAGGGGGALALVASGSLSTPAAAYEFSLGVSSSYDYYMIVIDDISFSVGSNAPIIRFSTDGGSTFLSTSIYRYHHIVSSSNSATREQKNSNAETRLLVSTGTYTWTSSDTRTGSVVIDLHNDDGLTNHRNWNIRAQFTVEGDGQVANVLGGGSLGTTAQITDIQFGAAAGNVDKLRYRVYGISNA